MECNAMVMAVPKMAATGERSADHPVQPCDLPAQRPYLPLQHPYLATEVGLNGLDRRVQLAFGDQEVFPSHEISCSVFPQNAGHCPGTRRLETGLVLQLLRQLQRIVDHRGSHRAISCHCNLESTQY